MNAMEPSNTLEQQVAKGIIEKHECATVVMDLISARIT
jgi:hypothetical protein